MVRGSSNRQRLHNSFSTEEKLSFPVNSKPCLTVRWKCHCFLCNTILGRVSTSAPLKSGSHLPTLTDWRWHRWQVSGEDFSWKYKHQILLRGHSIINTLESCNSSTPTAHKGKTNRACQEPSSFKICKSPMFRTATILGKTPPCHFHQQSKNPLLWQYFLCWWCFKMLELENKTGTLSRPSERLNAAVTCG